MAKRKITVTVDEALLLTIERLGPENLSALVNDALADRVDLLARRAALRGLLDHWARAHGKPSERMRLEAEAAFDELDGALSADVA